MKHLYCIILQSVLLFTYVNARESSNDYQRYLLQKQAPESLISGAYGANRYPSQKTDQIRKPVVEESQTNKLKELLNQNAELLPVKQN
ncbi:MAG TPA: hypothetical protein VGW78_06195 [Candidatus Babeliales bacterium]|jgi:hypothetical protein|nr:hypothetical protein [Candidatus Babeliales bacterium]